MKNPGARGRVHRARLELVQAEHQLATGWRGWRDRLEQHRLAVLIGAGLLSGIALTTVSPQRWSRVGAAVFGSGAWLARSAVGPALLGALYTSMLKGTDAPDPGASQGQGGCDSTSDER